MYRENARKRRNISVRAIIWPISIFLVGRFKGHLSQIILNLELIMINSAEYSREFFLGSRFCKWLLKKHNLAAKQQEKTFWKNGGCFACRIFHLLEKKARRQNVIFQLYAKLWHFLWNSLFNQVFLNLKSWNNFEVRNR